MGLFPDDPASRAITAYYQMQCKRRKQDFKTILDALDIPKYDLSNSDGGACLHEDGEGNYYEASVVHQAIGDWLLKTTSYNDEELALHLLTNHFKIQSHNILQHKETYPNTHEEHYLYGDPYRNLGGYFFYESSDVFEAVAAWIDCEFPDEYRKD